MDRAGRRRSVTGEDHAFLERARDSAHGPRDAIDIVRRMARAPLARRTARTVSVLVFVAACLPFLPLLQADFVDWDDDHNFVDNVAYRGLTPAHLKWMFTTFHYGGYHPLSWLSVAIDHAFWGMDARGYHLTNILVHAANAVLLLWVAVAFLRTQAAVTTATVWAAGAAAVLFAVHPLRVESVAWITERRGLLAALFLLASVLFYLRAHAAGATSARRLMVLSIAMFTLSLLSKGLAMVLPVLLLVLDVWPLRRLAGGAATVRRLLVEKIPYVVIAFVIGLFARMAQQEHGATYSFAEYGLLGRLAQTAYSLCYYVGRTFWPAELCVLHPLEAEPGWGELRFGLAGVAVLAATLALLVLRRRWPAALVAWLAYGILLAPVSGLAQAGPSLVAERYSYLPTAGFFVLAAWALARAGGSHRSRQKLVTALVVTLALVWAGLSHVQSRHWRDSVTLWTRAVAIHPDSVFGHLNLGGALGKRGRHAEAAAEYERVVARIPRFGSAWWGLALSRFRAGDREGALPALQSAREAWTGGHWTTRPVLAEIVYMQGMLRTLLGRHDEALRYLREALAIDATYVHTYPVLADVLVQRGERQEAIATLESGLGIAPNDQRLREMLARLRQ